MPYYIYGRPVRPADHLKNTQQGVATDHNSKATPSSSQKEKYLEEEDNPAKAEDVWPEGSGNQKKS